MDTKSIIRQAAFELFSEKIFKDITVQDIIDRAKCSRYTFYRYFQDKYELMRLYYTSYVTELLVNDYDGGNYPDIQTRIFQFVLDNRGYFANIKDFSGAESFWTFLTSYTTAFFSTAVYLNTGTETCSDEDDFEMTFIVNGAVSLFRKYVEDPSARLNPQQISQLLCAHYPLTYYVLPAEKINGFSVEFNRFLKKTV